nr:MAG TPA: hypothetical protein [Caudoviricetes sp.]
MFLTVSKSKAKQVKQYQDTPQNDFIDTIFIKNDTPKIKKI